MLTVARWRHDLREMISQFEYLRSQLDGAEVADAELKSMLVHVLDKSRAKLALQYETLTSESVVAALSGSEGLACSP